MTFSDMLVKARAKVWEYQNKLECFPDCMILINRDCYFTFKDPEIYIGTPEILMEPPEPFLHCFIDQYILMKILHRDLHFNDAEVSMQITYNRVPNIHQPAVHTLMSFFHL